MSKKIPKRPGRSIEEILVRRKLDGTDPSSWPDPNKRTAIFSRSLPKIPIESVEYAVDRQVVAKDKAPDTDAERVIEQLVDYCKSLQSRIQVWIFIKLLDLSSYISYVSQELESRVATKITSPPRHFRINPSLPTHGDDPGVQDTTRSIRWRSSSSSNSSKGSGGEVSTARAATDVNPSVVKTIGNLDQKVLQLRELFNQVDPIEARKRAATKIAACIRGFIARAHYAHYHVALKEWKWSRCRRVVWLLDMLLGNQSKLDAGLQQLNLNNSVR